MSDLPEAAEPTPQETGDTLTLTILHHGNSHPFTLSSDSTLTDLTDTITSQLSIPSEHQKFLVSPKTGLLKPPYKDPDLPLSALVGKKIQLLAPTAADLSSIARPPSTKRNASAGIKPGKISRARGTNTSTLRDRALYSFHSIAPLPHLPDPERSRAFLQRLADDPGVQRAMASHKFSVGVLTELDPASLANTNRDGRTLGLNRNGGEAIELRLRTDAGDGYRDYRGVRRTLCHELAHNLHSEHDRDFWELTKQLEREVERGDWTSGGHRLGGQEVYVPPEEREESHVDGGGWKGRSFVLGTGETGRSSASGGGLPEGLSRREVMAKAAEERLRKQKEVGLVGGSEDIEERPNGKE